MYIQLDADYWQHPKTLHLVRLLGQGADSIPPRLWCWCLKYAPEGILTHDEALAAIGGSDPLQAVKSLLEAKFIDPAGDGLYGLHNWCLWTGRFLERYEAKKERMRKYQEEKRVDKRRGEESKVSGNYPDTIRKVSTNSPEDIRTVSAQDEVKRQLLQLAETAKIAARPDTLSRYLDSWIERVGAQKVQELLMRPDVRGKTVTEIQDLAFPKQDQAAKRPAETINGMNGSVRCGVCGDTGKVPDYVNGKMGVGPCSCTRRRQAKA